jgi:hypothetical protein
MQYQRIRCYYITIKIKYLKLMKLKIDYKTEDQRIKYLQYLLQSIFSFYNFRYFTFIVM